MNSGIYRILHRDTGREYVGQSQNIEQRWHQHRWAFRHGIHYARHLQAAWIKYGEAAFVFEVLLLCSVEHLDAEEQKFLDERRPVFNTAPFASSCRGVKHSEEVRARMSAAKKGKKLSAEHKAKLSKANIGRKASPQTIEKLRAVARLRGISPETVAKGRAACKGRKQSPEAKAKIGAASRGRTLSAEARAKIRAARLGRKFTDEHKAKLRAAKVGKPWSDARRKANNRRFHSDEKRA